MINQYSNSQICNSQLLLTYNQLIGQILRIKYQQQQINNRAFRSLELLIPSAQIPLCSGKMASKQQIACKQFMNFYNSFQYIQMYYSFTDIKQTIKNAVLQRTMKDFYQPQCLIFYQDSLKLRFSIQMRTSKVKSNLQIKSRNTESTAKNSKTNILKHHNILSQFETCQQSSMVLQKINHDLSRMIQSCCRKRIASNSFTLSFNHQYFLKKTIQKQKQFKKLLKKTDISQIQPIIIDKFSDEYNVDQGIEYGLKKITSRKQRKSQNKKHSLIKNYCQEASTNSRRKYQRQSNSKKKSACEKGKRFQANNPFRARSSQKITKNPLTPTPRYLQQTYQLHTQKSQWRDHSLNSKAQKKNKKIKSIRKYVPLKRSKDKIIKTNSKKLCSFNYTNKGLRAEKN